MIDLHTHTFFSDGVLSPAEHVRRALINGYTIIGITDHADFSNYEFIFESIDKFIQDMHNCGWDIKIISGIEITHVPVKKIESLVFKARELKIPLIVVHGETIVEPVEKGTNRAGIEAKADIIAHPGLILEEDVKRAEELGISLEITTRRGHSLTNGHVAKLALKHGAKLVINTDSHAPGDYFTPDLRENVLLGAGIEKKEINRIETNMKNIAENILNNYLNK
ncbi:MAG: histidinol phosphate phosphatase domain-containing protein [Spirochaetes bacterium]|nr:histidinol phosphate phosphatase domain-containing protein [Spirochaetota bacterium]